MPQLPEVGVRNRADLERLEAEMTLEERLPERSVFDVIAGTAARHGDRTAITQIMTGAPDETPRRVTYRELLGLVRRAANLFASLGGRSPVVAYMLPALIETHATLWGAETAGTAVPINFLLQPPQIAALLEASGARILVALGPHPALDIWQKALALREKDPGLTLVRVSPPGTPIEDGVIDLGAALTNQPDDQDLQAEAPLRRGGARGVAHRPRGARARDGRGERDRGRPPRDARRREAPRECPGIDRRGRARAVALPLRGGGHDRLRAGCVSPQWLTGIQTCSWYGSKAMMPMSL
jgi:hypothetical protein